jgi:hypothetical protein
VLCRFDLFPAVLAAGGLLVLARRPGGSGVLVALGAAIKVWPVVVLPALLLTPRIRWRLAAVFVVVSLAGVVAVVATGGTERLLSPFQWRSDRGLQIEAFVALPALVRSIFVPGDYAIGISEHLAFEITGPWVDTLVQASSWLTLGGLGLLGVIWLRALVSRAASPELVGLLATLTVWVMIVVDKTFSPQYLTWVAALLAATAAIAPSLPSRIVRVMLLSAVGTQLVYPVTYPWLTLEYGDGPLARAAQVAALLLLIGRDACLIGLGVLLVRRTWALTRPAEPVPLPHPG